MVYQTSPAKRALHHQLKDTITTTQDEITPHHSSNEVRFNLDKATLSSDQLITETTTSELSNRSQDCLSNEGSSTTCSSEGLTPSLSQINSQTGTTNAPPQHKVSISSIEEQENLTSLIGDQEDVQDPLKWITTISENADQINERAASSPPERNLPPVPSRLVPSQSTERIMEILKQRGLAVDSNNEQKKKSSITKIEEESQTTSGVCDMDELSSGSRNDVLSSTPAMKSSGELRRASDHLFMVSTSPLGHDFDRGSVNSISSLPEGTFFGDARHKDGSLMAIIFQVRNLIHMVIVMVPCFACVF